MVVVAVALALALLLVIPTATAGGGGGNLGTITAGTITGVSATFGGSGGEVTLNSSGITITSGTDQQDRIKWDNGSLIETFGSVLYLEGSNAIALTTGIEEVRWDGGQWTATDSDDLGNNSSPWRKLYVNSVRVQGLDGGGNQDVCVDNSGDLYTCGAAVPAPAPLAAHIAALEQEVAELRAQVQQLLANRP
jgi:hypothetical protein